MLKKTQIQSLAEFFGWERNKAIYLNQSSYEIAPNGVRRTRRINNSYIPEDAKENSDFYISKLNKWLNSLDIE